MPYTYVQNAINQDVMVKGCPWRLGESYKLGLSTRIAKKLLRDGDLIDKVIYKSFFILSHSEIF